MDGVRMVKVDNWAAFFLQKLQALYTRGDFTDLTLQFHTNECIKVHRLVLNTCTEYFETLIQQNNATNHMRLPPNFQSDVVVPIINFMYSGRLEFRPELHQRLYNTAKILNMHILTKLLDTHAGPVGKTATVQKLKHLTPVPASVSSPPIPSSPLNSRSFIKSDFESSDIVPGKRLPIWKKRTVPSSSFSVNVKPRAVVEEPAKPTRFEWPEDGDSDSAPILYSSTFDDISYDSVPIVKSINSIVQSALPPTPSQPLVQLPQQRVMPAATFESVYQSANLKRSSQASSQEIQPDGSPAKKLRVDIDDVKELVQEQEVRKTLITDDGEQENEDLDDFLPVADHDAGDFEDDNDEINNESMDPLQQSTQSPCHTTPPSNRNTPKPILKVHDSPDARQESTPSKKVRFHLEPKVHAVTSAPGPSDAQTSQCTEVDSESATADENTSEKSGSNQPVGGVVNVPKRVDDSAPNSLEVRASAKRSSDGSSILSKTPNATNHAKIIAEVLKKYPDLVKNNKNIRLKIIQKDGSPAVSLEKPGGGESKPKVSYMVVKADQAVKAKAQMEQYKTQSGVHNTTGPWICTTCDPENPINFETYYSFRKHLQEIHQEKIDVRICEHCGHKANKRNLLLYHLYKIHGIPPPPSCHFPKCDECSHIALSEALLIKHKNVHSHSSHAPATQTSSSVPAPERVFLCRMCNVTFSSQNALQNHLQSSQRCNPRKKSFKCPVCSKVFQLQLNLKNHIRTDHPNLKLLEDMTQTDVKEEEQPQISPHLQLDEMGQQQQVLQHQQPQQLQQPQLDQSHQHSHASQDQLGQQVLQTPQGMEVQSEVHTQGGMSTQPQTTYILPPGVTILTDNNQATLMPSTEAEALSNVASGIAASLGVADSMVVGDQGQHQTFIVVDKNSLIQIPGPPGAPGQVHEYIVPDIMNNDMSQSVGVYTPQHLSQLVQYTTAGAGLQQPVAVSTTDQGLMTITTVNANGSIVNHTVPQQAGAPIMETAMMQIPQGHMQDHSGGEITMILTDHAYSEGIVRENGAVMQTTTVPVSMNMVPTSAVVSVVSAVPSIQTTVPSSSPLGDNGVHQVMTTMSIPKVDSNSDSTNNPSVNLDPEQQASDQPAQKMAELASDWDDVDESEDNSGIPRSADEVAEDAALPSRPSIMLKSELDGDDIPDNLPMKIA